MTALQFVAELARFAREQRALGMPRIVAIDFVPSAKGPTLSFRTRPR